MRNGAKAGAWIIASARPSAARSYREGAKFCGKGARFSGDYDGDIGSG